MTTNKKKLPLELMTPEAFRATFAELITTSNALLGKVLIKNLPLINSQYGEDVGAAVIKRVSDGLLTLKRADFVAEISPSLYEIGSRDAAHPQELVTAVLELEKSINRSHEFTFLVGLSFGVVVARADEYLSVDEWTSKANAAMMRSGRTNLGEILQQETEVGERVRDIFSRLSATSPIPQGMSWVYQRVNYAETGETFGYEALCRWNLPGFGPIAPDFFIHLAEEMGVIEHLDLWALTAVEKALGPLLAVGGASISLNVSAKTLHYNHAFIHVIEHFMKRTAETPCTLILELTETSVMIDQPDLIEKLIILRQKGIRIAIDDFGTGQTSLSLIGNLPCDYVKLDSSLLRAGFTELNLGLLQLGMKFAELLGAEAVVEGVESEADLLLVKSVGAKFAQGWYYGQPLIVTDDGTVIDSVKNGNHRHPTNGINHKTATPTSAPTAVPTAVARPRGRRKASPSS